MIWLTTTVGPGLGADLMRWTVSVCRRAWRAAHHMRTALILLFLLAVAAIPGSVLPQRDGQPRAGQPLPAGTPPTAGPTLDRLCFFDVFGSPWFSAIYLLLFTLAGRLPRAPAAPSPADAAQAAAGAGPAWTGCRTCVRTCRAAPSTTRLAAGCAAGGGAPVVRRTGDVTVSAEKGYLKETGNLRLPLRAARPADRRRVRLLVRLARQPAARAGPDFAFCNTLQQYDEHALGARSTSTTCRVLRQMDKFAATVPRQRPAGQYKADVTYAEGPAAVAEAVAPARSTTRCGWTARTCPCSATATRRSCVHRQVRRTARPRTPVPARGRQLTSDGVATFPDANVDPRDRRPRASPRSASPASTCRPCRPRADGIAVGLPWRARPRPGAGRLPRAPGPGRRASRTSSYPSTSARSTTVSQVTVARAC